MFQFIRTFVLYAKVARVQTLVMSFLPCVLAYVYCKPRISNFSAFILVCVAIILFHLSVNTISEYRDCVNGVDNPNSPGTKYRLVTGIVPKQSILYLGLIAFCIASICGIIAVMQSSFILIIPGLLAGCIVFSYSERPLCIKYKGLGELAVFLCYGLLLGFSTVYAATGSCSVIDILVFIPGALLIVNVLLVNNIRDYFFDKLRITTLTTIIGIENSYSLLYTIFCISVL